MPRYIEITEKELQDARAGLALMEQVFTDGSLPCLYAITNKEEVLLAAGDALTEDGDGEPAPQLAEVAIAITISSDTIYYLTGSGLKLTNEDFAFLSGEDDVRTLSFTWAHQKPRVTLRDFSKLALAEDDMYLDAYLQKNWSLASGAQQKVKREEPATGKQPVRSTNPIDTYLAG